MVRVIRQNETRNSGWMAAFWLTGVVLFMMELQAVLNYVESRFADLSPNPLGVLPAWGLATLKLAESAFWNYGQLEATFQIAPFIALPFAFLGLSLSMKGSIGFPRQQDHT